jgi:octaprenyl-diphosphate synthase
MDPGSQALPQSAPLAHPSSPEPRPFTVPGVEVVARELIRVEQRLAGFAQGAAAPLPALTGHLVGSGGKRVRPLILLLSARACGVEPEAAVPLATAAELVHSASLLHDDVVDEAHSRRGRPAAHQRWGNAPAVLSGDYCLASAMAEIATLGRPEPVSTMAETVQELAQGELLQLARRSRPTLADALDEQDYYRVLDQKTASLLTWCARVGGLLPPPQDRALRRYGRALGRSFQIADDVLDYQGDPAVTGKDLGADLREGKVTLPLIEACRRRPDLSTRLARALGMLPAACAGPAQGDIARPAAGSPGAPTEKDGASEPPSTVASRAALGDIARQVRACGAVDAARTHALEAARQARDALHDLPRSPAREALHDLARYCADRLR